MTRLASETSRVVARGVLSPGSEKPLLATRAVVLKFTLMATAVLPTVTDAGAVQAVPAGAVPDAAQVNVIAPVKPLIGVRFMPTPAFVPAVTETVEEVCPVEMSVMEKSGTSPVPVRLAVNIVAA